MNVEEFLSTMDALRFDTSLDETYPELRGMVRKAYPYIRKIYNMMNECGILAESVNEAHGVKKHNSPKDTLSAIRKGNRDAEKEIYGDGFKSKKKLHKAKSDYNRKDNKIDINDIDKFKNESVNKISLNDLNYIVTECVKSILKEDVDGQLYGLTRLEGQELWDRIQEYLDNLGLNDTHVSKFYSNLENNVVIAVNVNDDRNKVVNLMKELGYKLYDTGGNGEYVMMTFKRF